MPGPVSPLDAQIWGVQFVPDPTEGAQLVKVLRDQLAMVPFRASQTTVSGGTFNFNANPANNDGTNTGVFLNPTNGLNAASWVKTTFQGRSCGIRFMAGLSGICDFTAVLDTVAYKIPASSDTFVGNYLTTQPREVAVILSEDLPDGEHHLLIQVTPSANAADAARQIQLCGLLLDTRVGYRNPATRLYPTALQTNLSTSPVQVLASSTVGKQRGGIFRIFYRNNSAGAVGVNLQFNSGAQTAIDVLTVPANGRFVWDAGMILAVGESGATALYHYAGSANTINWWSEVGD